MSDTSGLPTLASQRRVLLLLPVLAFLLLGALFYARLGAAPDHPMTVTFPEGEYLKGLVLIKR